MTEACGPSSDELKTNVANFMERADEIAHHPLAGTNSTIKVTIGPDSVTGALVPVGFDMNLLPKADWLYLAVIMRPIISTEQDAISFNVLTNRIEREHVTLRRRLKPGRDRLAERRKTMFVGAQQLGTVTPPQPQASTPERGLVAFGPPGQSPTSVPLEDLSTDYEYAWEYLNANVWHADSDKAARYQASSDHIKRHYQKCAEIRTLSATGIVLSLRQWILDARADGHDF